MKFIHFLALILALNFSSEIFAQVSMHKSEWNFSVGQNYGYFKDSNFSPLNYRQKGLSYVIGYTNHKQKNGDLFSANLRFSPNIIKTDVSELITTDYLLGGIEVDYLKKLKKSTPNFSYYLGGQFKSDNQFVSYDDLESYTFMFAHGFGIKGIVNYQLGEGKMIQSSLAIPLISLMTRPPYNGLDKIVYENRNKPLKLITDGIVTSLNTYIAFDWNTQFRFAMNNRFDLGLNYGLQFRRSTNSNKLTHLQNQFSVNVIFKN